MRKFKRRRENFAQISMLNLIDVIFILLIFFMLSTTFKKLWQFEVNLPSASASSASYKQACSVIMNADAEVFWLDENIKRVLDLNAYEHLKSCENIELSADKSLSYEQVAHQIGEFSAHEITSIKLNIERN